MDHVLGGIAVGLDDIDGDGGQGLAHGGSAVMDAPAIRV
jgi:hypothetical protein